MGETVEQPIWSKHCCWGSFQPSGENVEKRSQTIWGYPVFRSSLISLSIRKCICLGVVAGLYKHVVSYSYILFYKWLGAKRSWFAWYPCAELLWVHLSGGLQAPSNLGHLGATMCACTIYVCTYHVNCFVWQLFIVLAIERQYLTNCKQLAALEQTIAQNICKPKSSTLYQGFTNILDMLSSISQKS